MMLEAFADTLKCDDPVENLRSQLIGEGVEISGPSGPRMLVYADYVASGRALRSVEDFIAEKVLPFYANSHSRASYCGDYITRMRDEARRYIAKSVGASAGYSVIFTGAGATAAVNRLVWLTGLDQAVREGRKPVVFLGPYEHHSNILPWRETGAEVVIIPESESGGPDIALLETQLRRFDGRSLKIGSFSAASNVTGITTDVGAVSAILKKHGALSFWDYAGAAPYMPVRVQTAQYALDAIFLSCHKFPGGPGASGILVIRNDLGAGKRPSWPGGGTVSYVSPWNHDYVSPLAAREEAGTPNIIGDIRAALCFLVKDALDERFLEERQALLRARAMKCWRHHPNICLLGNMDAACLPVFSFRVCDGKGGFIHHHIFTRMLSDMYGIQARGGCACAGPYGHALLGIDARQSADMRREITAGTPYARPGWVRLNFSYLMSDEKADFIIESVAELANSAGSLVHDYVFDDATGCVMYKQRAEVSTGSSSTGCCS